MYHICIRVHNSVKRVYVHAHEHVHKVSVWPGHATFSRMHTHTRVSRYAVWPTLHNGNDSLFLCDITCLWHAVGRRTPVRDRGDGCYVWESAQVYKCTRVHERYMFVSCREKSEHVVSHVLINVEISIFAAFYSEDDHVKTRKSLHVLWYWSIAIAQHAAVDWLLTESICTMSDSCCYNSDINFANFISLYICQFN